MFAVDPTLEVAREAATWGADLLVVHHPLFLKPVHGFAATTPKGRTLATLAGADCALLTAHTNADQAVGGVSEAMAAALGLTDLAPILPAPQPPMDKLTVFVPAPTPSGSGPSSPTSAPAGSATTTRRRSRLPAKAGSGRSRAPTPRSGPWAPPRSSTRRGSRSCSRAASGPTVVSAMVAAHPYETPAYDVVELADPRVAGTGTGRIGSVAPTTLRGFADTVAAALPQTAGGVRVAGDPDRPVRRVALCGGAGDFLLDAVASTDADVYVTSDLRHHPAAEFVERGGPALVDVAHWAAEWTWLPVVEAKLRAALGDTVETRVSTTRTDPWQFRT